VAAGLLTEACDHAPCLRVHGDLAAMHQMRALTGLVTQRRVGIAERRRRRVGAAAPGRRPRPRLGKRQLRPIGGRSRGNVAALPFTDLLARRPILLSCRHDLKARAQARKRRVGLDVEPVDRQVRPVDQAVLATQRDRPQEQPLEQLRIDEPPRLGVTDRLMHRQALAEPIAQEAADVHAQRGDTQKLAHRPDPLKRADQHQLHQHDRIDRRAPHIDRVIPRRLSAHEPPIDRRIKPPQPIIDSNQLVQTHHLDLQRRRLSLHRSHSHPARVLNPPDRPTIWTGP
jgi:hypothetical protein